MHLKKLQDLRDRLFTHVWDHPLHWRAIIFRLIIAACALAAIIVLGWLWGEHIPEVEAFIKHVGIWGPLVFMVLFIALMPFFVPNAGFALLAGALFGLWYGMLYVVIAGLIAELVLFSAGHKLLRARVDKMLTKHPKLLALRSALTEKPIRLMILLRLSPIPFTPICYTLSTTRVSYRDYIIGYAGFLPGNFVTVYCGFVAKHVAKSAGGADDLSPAKIVILVITLIASIMLITYISHASKKALEKVQNKKPPV